MVLHKRNFNIRHCKKEFLRYSEAQIHEIKAKVIQHGGFLIVITSVLATQMIFALLYRLLSCENAFY